MKLSKLFLLMAALVLPAAVSAQQAPSRFGIVNTDRLLADSKTSQQIAKSLEAEFTKRDGEIAAGPKDQVERRRAALNEDLNLRRQDALKQFIEKSNRMIKRVAEAERLDIVFFQAAYANKSVDITDKVIRELDSGK